MVSGSACFIVAGALIRTTDERALMRLDVLIWLFDKKSKVTSFPLAAACGLPLNNRRGHGQLSTIVCQPLVEFFGRFAVNGLLWRGQPPDARQRKKSRRESREPDSNRRPRGYEPRELPGCSIPGC